MTLRLESDPVADAYSAWLTPSQRDAVRREIAWAWVRAGDVARAPVGRAAVRIPVPVGPSVPDSPRSAYQYAIVRVVPRVDRGEFVNVGVILFCRPRRFLAARIALDAIELTPEGTPAKIADVLDQKGGAEVARRAGALGAAWALLLAVEFWQRSTVA